MVYHNFPLRNATLYAHALTKVDVIYLFCAVICELSKGEYSSQMPLVWWPLL